MPTYRKKMSIRRRKPKSKSGVVSDSVKKYVKSVTKKSLPEMKHSSTIAQPTEATILMGDPAVAGFVWSEFLGIVQGTGVGNRIGNTIKLQGFHSKITYYNNSSVPVYVRRLIVSYPINDSLAGTSGAELFNVSGTGADFTVLGNNLSVIQTPINPTQYKVYFDKTFRLAPATATDGTNTRMINYFEKFGGKNITYENNAVGLLSQNTRFAEVIIVVMANNDITTGTLEYSRNTRTYFTDP